MIHYYIQKRQSGKTTQMAKLFLQDSENNLILVPRQRDKQSMERIIHTLYPERDRVHNVYTPTEMNGRLGKDILPDNIYIDEFGFWTKQQMEILKHVLKNTQAEIHAFSTMPSRGVYKNPLMYLVDIVLTTNKPLSTLIDLKSLKNIYSVEEIIEAYNEYLFYALNIKGAAKINTEYSL